MQLISNLILHVITVLVLILALSPHRCDGNRAPDEAPDLPDGWCDRKYGVATRTTAECICNRECEGSRCRREQGLIWYSYTECPTCKCIPGSGDSNKSSKEAKADSVKEDEGTASFIIKGKAKNGGYQAVDPLPGTPPEEEFNFGHWIDDNGRYLFAGLLSLVVVAMIILGIMFGFGKHERAAAEDDHSNSHSLSSASGEAATSTLNKKD